VFVVIDEWIIYQDLCPVKIEIERHFLQTLGGEGLAHPILTRGFAKQEEKPTTSCASNLATGCAALSSQLVEAVDARIRNAV
jgi:hypothetical protein